MKGHYIAALIDSLCEVGADRETLLEQSGLKEADLNDKTLIDPARLYAITKLAADQTSDPAVGLSTGQRLNINSHGALGYAAMASENLEHALQLLLKYYRVQAPQARFSWHHRNEHHHLICDPSFVLPEMPWLTAELLVASIYTSVEFLLSGRSRGLEVWFRHEQPAHVGKYQGVFSAPVSFGQSFNGLVIPDRLASLPLLSADTLASSIFEKRCAAIQQETRQQDLAARIRGLQSQGRFLSQAEVARRLSMSVSTLHRRMDEEGIDYKQLVAEIKKEFALEHLRDGVLSVEEIAQILGFSDASNFRRAFVAWTGMTPSEAREEAKL
ncbi:AraC family transcriptional regulator [Hydrocarboniclastica marina]|uniref:AraC family transcriptional regulator n=1 Tax=Hydrocarboniclastica marina TaxID=2259620 RepID=A0A4V1D8H0_9ALTE|nr:AraC family transcriptional regulator [Hydrocarboniclastica marina]QCF25160.1 AraC family transcriptional regulator [Hydrocarboniclastica marina]